MGLSKIVLAPQMVPGISMSRYHKKIGHYEVCFSSEYIESKYRNTDFSKLTTNKEHGDKRVPCKTVSSFLKSEDFSNQLIEELSQFASGTELREGFSETYRRFNDLPEGTWFLIIEFDSREELESTMGSNGGGISVEISYSFTVDGEKITTYEKFNRMDSPSDKLPYTLHIYGGSTFSMGRSEHGEAHLEVKDNGKSIDKIFIPNSNDWISNDLKGRIKLLTSEKGKVSRKDTKKIAEWLSDNWERCKSQWNENNKDNLNRVTLLY